MTLIRTQLSVKEWREHERLTRLAVELARDYAIQIVQSDSLNVRDSIGRLLWYEVDLADCDMKRALAYLEGCGLLRRHKRIASRVMLRWEKF